MNWASPQYRAVQGVSDGVGVGDGAGGGVGVGVGNGVAVAGSVYGGSGTVGVAVGTDTNTGLYAAVGVGEGLRALCSCFQLLTPKNARMARATVITPTHRYSWLSSAIAPPAMLT